MRAKQRVLAALDHRETDRVALDFAANPATMERLKRDLGASGHRQLLDRLHVDVVDLRGIVDPILPGANPRAAGCGKTGLRKTTLAGEPG